mmetsp:Transcript_17898/g.41075  ORF Transcript_17898/g.41075 Transcript_17898/m.41075 type:complete len:460 (-) Transcript_17898:161-1540(-)
MRHCYGTTVRRLMRNILIFACLAATRLVVPSSALVAPPSATCIRRPSRGSVFSGADLPQAVSKYPAARIAPLPSFVNTHSHAVAGRVPWEKLWLSRKQWGRIVSVARTHTHYLDLVPIGILAVTSERIGRFFYNRLLHRLRNGVDYEHSITKQVGDRIKQASRLALVCYVLDILEIWLEVAGIKGTKVDMSKRIAYLLFATWGAAVARDYKSGLIEAFVKRTTSTQRGARDLVLVYEKLSDFFLILVLVTLYGNVLNLRFGSGAFALGSAGTLVISLSVQDLVKRMVNGLMLSASDAFTVGDSIILGDGTSGTVTRMRWLQTEIKGVDEMITSIPNSQLSGVRICNKSRMKYSGVQQKLLFSYEDIDKIPQLVVDIKDEIRQSCPKVITNGSRPFGVSWTDYGPQHLTVSIDCRLANPPSGSDYYDARQGVLEAIARAMKKNGVECFTGKYIMRKRRSK